MKNFLTPQEIFTKVVNHLRKQRRQAVSSNGTCMYRAGDLRCAAGCLIDDIYYDERIEAQSVIHLESEYPSFEPQKNLLREVLEKSGRSFKDFELVFDLQCVHDGNPEVERWEARFRQLAEDYALEMPPP